MVLENRPYWGPGLHKYISRGRGWQYVFIDIRQDELNASLNVLIKAAVEAKTLTAHERAEMISQLQA